MAAKFTTQVAIVGGGVSGLWLLNVLRRRGYKAVLIEKDALGCGQTLASQGMIHGGIKYALGGFTTPSSESIAGMPDRWADCIAGRGDINLTDVRVLSEDYLLFSDRSITSRVTAFFGSKSIRGRVNLVKPDDYPACFRNEAFHGLVYRLRDLVVDTASLMESLAHQSEGRIFSSTASVIAAADGTVESLAVDAGQLVADTYIFAAGAGNGDLIKDINLSTISMQRRPLHQVMVKAAGLPRIFAHAVSAGAGAKPRVTFTTHTTRDGSTIWYLGGNLAETGVARSEPEQIAFAKDEMYSLFPWIPWDAAAWRTLRVDRAEPLQKHHSRPDTPFCKRSGNTLLCWPTKLSLTPLLADEALKALDQCPPKPVEERLPSLSAPPLGLPPWERAF